MRGHSRKPIDYAESLPEATPLCPAALLHLGSRAAVDQALSRSARSGHHADVDGRSGKRPGCTWLRSDFGIFRAVTGC